MRIRHLPSIWRGSTLLTSLVFLAGYLASVSSTQRPTFCLAFSNSKGLDVPAHAGNDALLEEKLLASIPSQYKEAGGYSDSGPFELPRNLVGRYSELKLSKSTLELRSKHFAAEIRVTFENTGRGGWAPVLSPDRRTVAYRAKEGKKEFIVIGDKKGEEFDEVRDHVFSPAGDSVTYRARINKRWFIVNAEQKGAEYDKVGPPCYSPNGKKVAYAARDGKLTFIVDGNEKGAEFERVSSPVYSPDGDKLAYVGYKNKECYLIVNGNPVAQYSYIGDFTFASKGGLYAYSAARNPFKWFVVVGEKRGREFEFVYAPAFNPDGSKVVYLAEDKDKLCIVVGDDQQSPKTFGDYSLPVFSPDGSRIAYFDGCEAQAFKQCKHYLFDGNQLVETYPYPVALSDHDNIKITGVDRRDRWIVFSPDGRLTAYRSEQAKKGSWAGTTWRIVIGKMLGPEFDYVGDPLFSSDGTKVAYLAIQGREMSWKVLDVVKN